VELGVSVLVADGDDESRAALAAPLRNAGYGVIETDRGDEALSLVRSTNPVAVILEIELAGLCGYEVCHLLKAQPGYEVPVISSPVPAPSRMTGSPGSS
jgi:DNA-binding response OmpR family regulator